MSVTQEHRTRDGCCPLCSHPLDQDFVLSNARGHLSDGLLFVDCPNCQESVYLEIEFVVREVLD